MWLGWLFFFKEKKVKGSTAYFRSPIFQEEKPDIPVTTYREMFLGHDPKKHPVSKAPSVHQSEL